MHVTIVPDPSHPNAYLIRFGETDQSFVDLDDPTRIAFDYVERIVELLDSHKPEGERMRVVHVGGAGMSIPRYVAHTRPTSPQIVLEPNSALVAQVREKLPLPRNSGIKVREVDGRSGIAAMRDDFAEVVVVDAFAGAQVPAELTTLEFLTDVARVLTASGMVVLNVTDHAPFAYTRGVVAGLQQVFPHVLLGAEPATLKGRRFGNLVLAGARGPFATQRLVRAAARAVFPYRLVAERALEAFVGGALPWTDAHSSVSPPPLRGRTSFH